MSKKEQPPDMSSRNLNGSKSPRLPFMLKAIQWMYPKVEMMAPQYAHRWFVKTFFSPVRFPVPPHERAMADEAEQISLSVNGKHVQAYAWGQGPSVLLVHGWAGRATQFSAFIKPIVGQGFRAVAIDAPSHGASAGKSTNIFEFRDAILAANEVAGPFEAVIAHSLGGTAALFALTFGLPSRKLITIATPTLADEIIEEFASRLHASSRSQVYLRNFIYKRFNRPFESLMASEFAKEIDHPVQTLIIHDENDREASLDNAKRLNASCPGAELMITRGLGHVRILRDNNVIERCLQFIAAHSLVVVA